MTKTNSIAQEINSKSSDLYNAERLSRLKAIRITRTPEIPSIAYHFSDGSVCTFKTETKPTEP
jgi:hypothetical protein